MLFQRKIIISIFLIVLTAHVNAVSPAKWNINELNTASNSSYLSDFEKEVVLEINKLRSNPSKYASEYIEPLQDNYQGRKFYYPGDNPILTREGVRALRECLRVLKKQKPKHILIPDKGLTYAANDHLKDQSQNGGTGHKGHDKSDFKDRIERYGEWNIRIAENISYGNITPRQVVIYLLIDDGIKSRGHRKTFLNNDFKMIGVATGGHPYYENMCVMEFAGKFKNSITK